MGTQRFHQFPEAFRVVHLDQVGEFMHDDVIDGALRSLYKPPVKPHFAAGIATSPARPGAGQKQSGNSQIETRRERRDAAGEIGQRMTAVPPDDGGSDRGFVIRLGHRQQNPVVILQTDQRCNRVAQQVQVEFAAKVAQLVAMLPGLAARRERAPLVELFQHPGLRVPDHIDYAPLRAFPRRAYRQTMFIHAQDDAAPLLAALEQIGDLAVAQPYVLRLADRGDRKQVAYERALPRRATSVSIQSSAFRLSVSGVIPAG